jgi:NAD(P)-dependent dehydrogenase (short-subunit alcohol dehydrogenase family)
MSATVAADARVAQLFGVAGKRALVTGATSGIGRLIARGLAQAGVEVWAVARGGEALAALTRELSSLAPCYGIVADVSTDEGLAAIKEAIGERSLHVLVNNAGTNVDTPLEGNGRTGFDTVLGLNLTAPFLVLQAVLPNLDRAASEDDPARVINIASVAAIDPGGLPNYSYGASKSGLVMMTKHLGRHLAKRNITCNAISPGLFASRMTEQFLGMKPGDPPPQSFASPLGGRAGALDDIAGATIYLSSRAGAWVTGVMLPVSGGAATVKGF